MSKLLGANLDMLPRPAVDDIEDRDAVYSESLGKFFHRAFPRNISRPNSNNICFAQSRPWTFLAKYAPAFVSHVCQIIALSPKKKVTRIHASSIVASMADAKSFFDLAIMKLVRKTMRVCLLVMPTRSYRNATVAITPKRSLPCPARLRFFNIVPKSFGNSSSHIETEHSLLLMSQQAHYMNALLIKLFGANFQTTLTGGLQALFTAFVTGTLTFPSNWHDPKQVTLFALVIIGTFLGIKFAVAAKSKDVTGGTIQQTADGAVASGSAQAASSSVIETKQAAPKP